MNVTDIDTPSGVTVKTDANRVKISWQYVASGWGIVTGFWILALIMFFVDLKDLSSELVLCAFPTIILSLVMLYCFLLWLLNKKVVEVSHDALLVGCEGPIPCLTFDQVIDSTEIRQVYVIERISGGRYQSRYYDVHVLTKDGGREKIVTVPNGNQALYLEQEIERFLGIEDQVVRGEWRPTPYLWEK
jgi:hypothetical protein